MNRLEQSISYFDINVAEGDTLIIRQREYYALEKVTNITVLVTDKKHTRAGNLRFRLTVISSTGFRACRYYKGKRMSRRGENFYFRTTIMPKLLIEKTNK